MPTPPAAPPDPAVLDALATLGSAGAAALAIGGMPASELAERFGTPLYVFDAAVLRSRLATVRRALGPQVQVLWSIKANPSLAVTATLREAGAGAEVASLGELHVALAAGHRAADLRFAGPGKAAAELDAALAAGLGCFHVESAAEVAALTALAARRGVRAGVAVRVNLPQELGGARLRMGGRSSRFGVDAEQVPELLRAIAGAPSLALRGLHVYGGTQCFDAAAFVAHAARLVDLAGAWERELGAPLDELDLGGGFGVPVYHGDPAFDLGAAARGVDALVAAHARPGRAFFVELGRYLAAPAGVYLARVVATKSSGGERHAVLDGGLHHCALAAGAGSVLRRPPLLVHATKLQQCLLQAVTVGGPLCTPADQFAEQTLLPELCEGDLVAVLNAGAYGASYSPTAFLSHATPAEVLVDGGRARVVRSRGDAGDVLRGQCP